MVKDKEGKKKSWWWLIIVALIIFCVSVIGLMIWQVMSRTLKYGTPPYRPKIID